MEEMLEAEIDNFLTSRVICRRGKPSDITSLEIVNPEMARSYTILRQDIEDPEDDIIKTILALRKLCGGPLKSPLVAEIIDPGNADAALRIDPKIAVLNASEIVIRIIAQSSREPGLSSVYEEILSFEGNEIYIQHEPLVEGTLFSEAILHYNSAVIIGVLSGSGKVQLNPPLGHMIEVGDSLICIAEDDDTVVYLPSLPQSSQIKDKNKNYHQAEKVENILIIGWHEQGKVLIDEFEDLLANGSTATVIYNGDLVRNVPNPDETITNVKWTFVKCDTSNRGVLDNTDPTQFDHVIILCYRDFIDPAKADSKTLLTLIT